MALLKQIEINLSNLLIRFLRFSGVQEHVLKPEDKFDITDKSKILLLRQDRIGDVIISVPVVKYLREKYPDIRIDMLFGNYNYGIRKAVEPYISNSYCYSKNLFKDLALIRKLRRENYDIIIDMFDNPSTTSALLIKLIKPEFSVGLDKENSLLYSHIVPLPDRRKVHIVERTANLLLPFGLDPAQHDFSLDYYVDLDDNARARELLGSKWKKPRLGINLSGSDKSKYWGTENYIDFIRSVSKKNNDIDVVIFAMRDDTEELKEILSSTNARQAPFVNSVHDYAIMLATCDYLLATDTSAVHFAAAFKVPTLVLYSIPPGDNNLKPWLPYKNKHATVSTSSRNISEIRPSEVTRAFQELSA
jgi:ADP-heptose:LPS heptosyltransferase